MANNLVVEPSRDSLMLLKSMPRLGEFYDLQATFVGQLTEAGQDVKLSSLSLCPCDTVSHKQLRHFESARIIRRRSGGNTMRRGRTRNKTRVS